MAKADTWEPTYRIVGDGLKLWDKPPGPEYTTLWKRRMMRLRQAQGDRRGVWFYRRWIWSRPLSYATAPILGLALGVLIGVLTR